MINITQNTSKSLEIHQNLNDEFTKCADDISDAVGQYVVEEFANTFAKLKNSISECDSKINDISEKAKFGFWFSGVKEVLFWTSCIGNISIAGYLIYTFLR